MKITATVMVSADVPHGMPLEAVAESLHTEVIMCLQDMQVKHQMMTRKIIVTDISKVVKQ